MTLPKIKSYDPSYLEEHVELGNRLTKDWNYFGQTGLEVMKQQYSRDDFDPETRLYAFNKEGKMIGFHTAAVVSPGFARVEFPIVDPEYIEVIDLLMQRQLEILENKGVTRIQSRATPFWGDTEKYADQFDYVFDRDLYFIINIELDDMASLLTIAPLTSNPRQLEDYNPTARAHYFGTKKILMEWFDCSEELAESYIASYAKPPPGTLLNQIAFEDEVIVSRVTLSKIKNKNSGEILGYASIYIDDNYDELLPHALGYALEIARVNGVVRMQCYLAGLSRLQIGNFCDPVGLEYTNALSFYIKDIDDDGDDVLIDIEELDDDLDEDDDLEDIELLD